MMRRIPIGKQDFVSLREKDYFYVDKTDFITKWWEYGSDVTAIMRPRRFGKTLTCSMVRSFFSVEYADRGEELFGGLKVWQDADMREIQGTYPVIFLSFASLKRNDLAGMLSSLRSVIGSLYKEFNYLLSDENMIDEDKEYFLAVRGMHETVDLGASLNKLSELLSEYHKKKVLIILDEYDTPMQEAYVNGYWEELAGFMRHFFNATFKTNSHLERGLMTGITRIAKESIFSDLNHLEIATMRSDKYADSFGFTEEEVFAAMDEYDLAEKDQVKKWYDGFIIGNVSDIYNPWSIINYLTNDGVLNTYWSNTSSNNLAGMLIQQGNVELKTQFDMLLHDETIEVSLDEEVVFQHLGDDNDAILSLLYTSGYLTGRPIDVAEGLYELWITNYETKKMFFKLIKGWFRDVKGSYNQFIKYMLEDNIDAMNDYINKISESVFSSFDTGNKPSSAEPERFYHGFVLGLMAELRDRYIITSNRESGYGRYDVMLEPRDKEKNDGIIMEFKVYNKKHESDLEETVKTALKQIEDKKYAVSLMERGVPEEKIRSYGFAFQGKKVLIGRNNQ